MTTAPQTGQADEDLPPPAGAGDSYDDLWNALQQIDTAAVFLPGFEVRHEGGIQAVTRNIVEAMDRIAKQAPDKDAADAPAGAGEPEMPEPAFRLTWDHARARYGVSKPSIDSTNVYTADQMRAYGQAMAEHGRREAMEEAVRLVEDVDEPAWYGYECPNTFQDGTRASVRAIRAAAQPQGDKP